MNASFMKNFPTLPSQVPYRGTPNIRAVAKKLFQAQGWSFKGEIPNVPKAVVILMPHTSNLDGWYGLLGLFGLDIKINILMKESLFKPPFGILFEKMDIMPVKRNANSGFTEQAIDILNSHNNMWLGIAPEGTRSHTEQLKTGFYTIATGANVPIVMFSMDYKNKSLNCIGLFKPTQNYPADLDKILAHYKGQFYPKHMNKLATPLKNIL